ncbi:hypothetical protein HOP50_08g51530 [Chloropicon primus]|uniref:Uncharacterized protein n=2 Tax=Chloropicon primus TaxID=1764295 RepID=A0A5B8MPK8_9CHLO|nr:hypothetical protein A3770_08p51260 [Chloropicon primus]UPR01830.1 hypothetical protein HOP50_08g51530 [Chloropicon primus]|eukprot:QDZ22608.1 hypothetical protein A3770_08p51260 [Chloropicon primus]
MATMGSGKEGEGRVSLEGDQEAQELSKTESSEWNELRRRMFCGRGLNMLLYLNPAMALFHGALFAVTLAVGNLNLSVPVYNIAYDLEVTRTEGGQTSWKLLPAGGTVCMDLKFTWMTACFFLISAVFHLLNCTAWRRWYIAGIAECRCPSRWIEYTFSASLMAVLIAYGAGMNIMLLLVSVFFLSATTMFFGHVTELLARPTRDGNSWTEPWHYRLQAHFMGYVPQLTAWFLIIYQFHYTAAGAELTVNGEPSDGSRGMPPFVYGIVWGELIVFWSFGLIQLVFTSISPKFYPYGELAYQIMSLVSKGILGLVLIVNVLMLSNFEDIYQ